MHEREAEINAMKFQGFQHFFNRKSKAHDETGRLVNIPLKYFPKKKKCSYN